MFQQNCTCDGCKTLYITNYLDISQAIVQNGYKRRKKTEHV